MLYPGTKVEIEEGDWIVYTGGPSDDHDYGQILAVEDVGEDGELLIEIGWEASGARTRLHSSELTKQHVPYTDYGTAKRVYSEGLGR